MTEPSSKHPPVFMEFMDGNHSFSHKNHPFSKVSTDMALEQSINRDSKSKGGVIGMSQNPQAVERWFLTSHERAGTTTALKEMCNINSDSGHCTGKKEGTVKRTRHDEDDVQKVISWFDSGLMTNPFSKNLDKLLNIASGEMSM